MSSTIQPNPSTGIQAAAGQPYNTSNASSLDRRAAKVARRSISQNASSGTNGGSSSISSITPSCLANLSEPTSSEIARDLAETPADHWARLQEEQSTFVARYVVDNDEEYYELLGSDGKPFTIRFEKDDLGQPILVGSGGEKAWRRAVTSEGEKVVVSTVVERPRLYDAEGGQYGSIYADAPAMSPTDLQHNTVAAAYTLTNPDALTPYSKVTRRLTGSTVIPTSPQLKNPVILVSPFIDEKGQSSRDLLLFKTPVSCTTPHNGQPDKNFIRLTYGVINAACENYEYANEQNSAGLTHSDLKPENFVVKHRKKEGISQPYAHLQLIDHGGRAHTRGYYRADLTPHANELYSIMRMFLNSLRAMGSRNQIFKGKANPFYQNSLIKTLPHEPKIEQKGWSKPFIALHEHALNDVEDKQHSNVAEFLIKSIKSLAFGIKMIDPRGRAKDNFDKAHRCLKQLRQQAIQALGPCGITGSPAQPAITTGKRKANQ